MYKILLFIMLTTLCSHSLSEDNLDDYELSQNEVLVLEFFKANKTNENSCTESGACFTSTIGNKFEVSLIESSDAKTFFEEFAQLDYMPYNYLEEGCPNRSLEIARLLNLKGFKAGHLMLEGDFSITSADGKKINWGMHAAPFLISEGNKKIIFDPALSNEPLSESEWKLLIGGKIDQEIILKSFFGYLPEEDSWVEYSFEEIFPVLDSYKELNREALDYFKSLETYVLKR